MGKRCVLGERRQAEQERDGGKLQLLSELCCATVFVNAEGCEFTSSV
jgi:hypothetical protein